MNNHDTIGIDLVAMSVNDLLARGAEAIAFLDYISYSVLDRKILDKILTGIVNGCSLAGCCLVGGESAQMPGLYSDGRYDLAGFAVGLVEHGHCLPKTESITPGKYFMILLVLSVNKALHFSISITILYGIFLIVAC